MLKKRRLFAVAILSIISPTVAVSDPVFGIGLTITTDGNVAVGGNVIFDDQVENAAPSIGLDYEFSSNNWRPNIGVSHLDDSYYIDLNLGLPFFGNEWDLGLGIGGYIGDRPDDGDDSDATSDGGDDLPPIVG